MKRQQLNHVYPSQIFPIVWALFGESVVPESVNAFLDEVLVVQSAVSFEAFTSPNKKGNVTQLLAHHFFNWGLVTSKCCLRKLNPKLTSFLNFLFDLWRSCLRLVCTYFHISYCALILRSQCFHWKPGITRCRSLFITRFILPAHLVD